MHKKKGTEKYIVGFINLRIFAGLGELKYVDFHVSYYFYFRMIFFKNVFMLQASEKGANFDKTKGVFMQRLLHTSRFLFFNPDTRFLSQSVPLKSKVSSYVNLKYLVVIMLSASIRGTITHIRM